MRWPLGTSVEGRTIEAYVRRGPAQNTTLILGGFHGDEPKGVSLARKLIDVLDSDKCLHREVRWVVISAVNPDAYERRKRRNANLVDINRNFPTRDWRRVSRRSRMCGGEAPASEPETRAVLAAVKRCRPSRIISIHSIDGGRHCNNYDGPGRDLARAMHRHNGYPVKPSLAYPTPGSFGTWAGKERSIPTITLELPSHHSTKRCWEDNRQALLCYV